MARNLLILLLFIIAFNVMKVHGDLVCPTLPPGTIGICIEGCSSDTDCKNGTKCCSNGCGHVCTRPVQTAVGTCPKYSFWWNIICWFSRKSSECNTDGDCMKPGQKCCMDPCKKTCVDQCYDSSNCECDTSKYPLLLPSRTLGVQCNKCTCIDLCQDYCKPGYTCVLQEVQCIRAPCYKIPKCVPACSNIMCMMYCPYGYVTDSNGCPICKCIDPCENVVCSPGTVCTVSKTSCLPSSTTNCAPYIGTCTASTAMTPVTPVTPITPINCSNVICLIYCQYGFMYDNNGCQICACLMPCANLLCPPGKICTISKSNCTTFSSTCQPYIGTCA